VKILTFFSSGLGDTLFVAPTILALRDIYPSAHIAAAVPYIRFNKFLLEDVLQVDDVLHLKRLRSPWPQAIVSYASFFCKFAYQIRRQKFDAVILTSQARLIDQYLLTALSGSKQRIGYSNWQYKKNKYRFLLTNRVYSDPHKHLMDIHFDIIRSLNKDIPLQNYAKKLSEGLLKAAQPCNFNKRSDKLLIVLPGTGSQPYKRWPFKNFLEVIKKIINSYSCDIAIVGSPNEYNQSLIPSSLRDNSKFSDLADSLSLPQLIDLFRRADLIVGNDSGLLHLAEFVNTPTVGIYAGNWEFHSKRFLDNDAKHIVLPKNCKDTLAEYYRRRTWITHKARQICTTIVNSVGIDDVLAEVESTALLK
jgi:ADP-heptose:LPS heptosyltransferase